MKINETLNAAEKAANVSVGRRALIKAGWAVPVAMMIASPRNASAGGSAPHSDHADAHTDIPHGDAHTDI